MSVPGENRGSDQLSGRDYEAIEQAVMESARGRWFLAEHAKRNRAADTLTLLDALKRIETTVAERPLARASDLAAIAATRADMAAVRNHLLPDGGIIEDPDTVFDTVAAQSKAAAAALMSSIEVLQKIAAGLRTQAPQASECDALDAELGKLQSMAWAQDVQSQRVAKAMTLLNHLERLTSDPASVLKLTNKNLEFFKEDEEIFEAEPREVEKEAKPSETSPSRIIVKQFARPIAPKALPPPETQEPKAATVTELRPLPPQEAPPQPAPQPEKPRITLIHRAATEEIYIPLASETSGPR